MEALRLILLFVHILGFAALLGGLLVQLRAPAAVAAGGAPIEPARKVNDLMRDGAGVAFLAGLGLVGVLEAGSDPVNHAKVGVKLLIGLVILVLVMVNLRRERIADGLYYGLLGLTVLNIAVAVFWAPVHA